MVAQMTTRFPFECTANPPISCTKCQRCFELTALARYNTYHAVPAGDRFYRRWLSNYLDELLSCISILVEIANVARAHLPVEWDAYGMLQSNIRLWRANSNGSTYMNALKPNRHVRDKRDLGTKLLRYLAFVDVVRKAIWDNIIRKILDVILGRWLCACP